MKKLLLLCVLCLCVSASQAQYIKKLKAKAAQSANDVKNKVKEKAENTPARVIDHTSNKVETKAESKIDKKENKVNTQVDKTVDKVDSIKIKQPENKATKDSSQSTKVLFYFHPDLVKFEWNFKPKINTIFRMDKIII